MGAGADAALWVASDETYSRSVSYFDGKWLLYQSWVLDILLVSIHNREFYVAYCWRFWALGDFSLTSCSRLCKGWNITGYWNGVDLLDAMRLCCSVNGAVWQCSWLRESFRRLEWVKRAVWSRNTGSKPHDFVPQSSNTAYQWWWKERQWNNPREYESIKYSCLSGRAWTGEVFLTLQSGTRPDLCPLAGQLIFIRFEYYRNVVLRGVGRGMGLINILVAASLPYPFPTTWQYKPLTA